MDDIWDDYYASLSPLIRDAMANEDYEILAGIQAVNEYTVWTGFQGMETLVNTLFFLTVERRREALQLRQRLREDQDHYYDLGVYKTMEDRARRFERGWISFSELKKYLSHLSYTQLRKNLKGLKEEGFIEARGSDIESSRVRLTPKLWEGAVGEVLEDGANAKVFSDPLGVMVALGVGKRGIKSLKPIVNLANRHGDDDISIHAVREEYAACGVDLAKFVNALERDRKKDSSIRMIEDFDGEMLRLTRPVLRFLTAWRNRSLQRARQRGLG